MSRRALTATLVLAAAWAAGCAKYYTDQADREVYGIVAEKNLRAFGRAPLFSVAPKPAALPTKDKAAPAAATGEQAIGESNRDLAVAAPGAAVAAPGAAAAAPGATVAAPDGSQPAAGQAALPPALPEDSPDAVRLTVADALRLAVQASRDYQAQKETVYLAALTLTLERYLFRPHPFWTGTVTYDNADARAAEPDRVRSWDFGSDVGVSQTLADGMVVAGSLGVTALRFINRQLGDTVDSTMNVTLTQPLWRGAGREIVQENLLQAERNAVYAVRTFARFEQTFTVSIASEYLRVIQDRDVVLNEWENYRSLVENRGRAEWLAKAERLPEFQVDQARQDELRAYNRWIVVREAYKNSLDAFKITLGIPVATEISLDPKELDRLAAAGLQQPKAATEEATAMALATRFDLLNTRDGVEDADRRIKVAENGLAGDVDLVASIGYDSSYGPPQSAHLRFNRGAYSLGFNIDMPVDRLRERNALRQTQISRQAAGRALDLTQDNVILQVRRAMRQLAQASESYGIQQRSVQLAERRVESTQLLLQAGRATQRDVLDSQRALVEARNALTSALVDHSIAVLQFQRDVGTLVVNEEGQIHGWVLTDSGR
ncbi:MAG: TolC family protein [Planctomycetes bacterium]|nr:TolC family protein [Planctomycetota bacterium]